jgi:hypothetical protein
MQYAMSDSQHTYSSAEVLLNRSEEEAERDRAAMKPSMDRLVASLFDHKSTSSITGKSSGYRE